MKKKVFLGILIFVFLASLSCSFPLYLENSTPTQESAAPEPSAIPPMEPSNENLDCGEDMGCFTQALQACQEAAQFLYVFEMDFGAISASEIRFTIQDEESDGCALHLKTERVDLSYSEEMVEQLKASGMTDAQIEEQLQMSVDALEAGKYDDICVGTPDDFVILLENWLNGHFNLHDFDPFTCSGKIFSNTNTTTVIEVTVVVSDEEIPEPSPTLDPNLPDGYTAQEPYTGDCMNRPENTACLGFSDSYIWLIGEPYIQERDQNFGEWQGHHIVKVTADKNFYYHILQTEYIKIVPRE